MTRIVLKLILILAASTAITCGIADIRTARAAPTPPPPGSGVAIHPSAAQPAPDGPRYDGELWVVDTTRGVLRYPVPVQPGDTITGWTLDVQRDSFGMLGPMIAARLERLPKGSTQSEGVGMGATNNAKVVGPLELAVAIDPPHLVAIDGSYSVMVAGDGVAGDRVGTATVYVIPAGATAPEPVALVPAAGGGSARPSDALRDPLDNLGGAIDDVSAARRHGWALGALVGLILIARSLGKARKRWPASRALAWMGGRVGGVVIGVGVVGSSAFDAIALGGSWVAAGYAAIGAALYLLMPDPPAPSGQRQPERGSVHPLLVIALLPAIVAGSLAAWSCAPLRSAGREGAPIVVDCTLVAVGEHADALEAAIRDATNLDGSIDWTRIRAAVRELGWEVGGCALRAAIERILGAPGVQAMPHPHEGDLRAGWERVRVEVLGGRRYVPEVR
jgi:hypothetical protein